MSDETAMLIDCLRYRPVAVTAAQMREAADLLAAWEQVWDALNEMGAGLGDANKPLAVTASWALATTERDECKREILALREQVAALESREVCTVAHDNVETCGYCQRDDIRITLAELNAEKQALDIVRIALLEALIRCKPCIDRGMESLHIAIDAAIDAAREMKP